MRSLSIAVLFVGGLTACGNACQDTCKELAAYAEECGYTVNEEEVDKCIDDFARANTSPEDRDHCKEFVDDVSAEWTCDEAARYMGIEGGSGGGEE